MWQRIQTLFLFLATLLIASLFWSDVAVIAGPDGSVEHLAYTDRKIYLIWIILLTVFHVLCLGGFKWRMRQFRMVLVTLIFTLGFQGWLVVDYFRFSGAMTFSWTALFPLAAVILDIMAARNIMLDEAIVQSANRLRKPRNKK